MGAPEIGGTVGEHTVSIFASEHFSEDGRGSRRLTAIEVSLNSIMPIVGGVASGGMIPILKLLKLKQEYRPEHPEWNRAYLAAASNRYVMQEYMSDARVTALCELMKIKHSWAMFVFKDDAMLLRLDTPDPLDKPAKVDKLIKHMVDVAKVLELQPGESGRLKSDAVKSAAKDVSLDVDDEALEQAGTSFELEDDQKSEGSSEEGAESASVSENEKS